MGFLLSTMVLFCSLLCTGVLIFGQSRLRAIVSPLLQSLSCLFLIGDDLRICSNQKPIASGLLGALLLPFGWWILCQTVETLWVRTLFEDLSLMHHLILSKGVVALSDVFWFVGGIRFFLWATERVLEWKRCQ